MNKGWVKYYRSIEDHELLANDNAAFIVFMKLLIKVDRKTGKYITGRFKLSELTNLAPSTAWGALKRLEKAEMVDIKADNKKSTIYICNWAKWQDPADTMPDNKRTTNEQQTDTKQEVISKKREVSTKVLTKKQLENRDPQVTQLISHFETTINPMPHAERQPLAAIQLIKQHGFERSMGAINAVVANRGKQYFPSIASLEELRDKWTKLEDYLGRERTNNKETVFIS